MTDHNKEGASRDDERVGHCRPPKAHQFKKGKSGNPRGRPKKPKPATMNEMIQAALNVAIEIKVDGKVKRVTKREAIVERHIHDAMSGKKGALQALALLSTMPVMTPPPPVDEGWITHTFHIDHLHEALDLLEREQAADEERERALRRENRDLSSDEGAVPLE